MSTPKPAAIPAVSYALAIAACADAAAALPGNDNADFAWCLADAAPYVDDARVTVEVRLRNARAVVGLAGGLRGATAGVCYDGVWLVGAETHPRAAVALRSVTPWSRAVRRRTLVLRALLDAAGLDTMLA